MKAFITGQASEEITRRIAEDLQKEDSYARKVLNGMGMVSRQFEELLAKWNREN